MLWCFVEFGVVAFVCDCSCFRTVCRYKFYVVLRVCVCLLLCVCVCLLYAA